MDLIASYAPEPRDLTPYMVEARRMLSDGAELEAVWTYLRANEVLLSESITVTVELTGVARRDAKWMVCHSQTWSDMLPSIEQLHDSFERALVQIAEEEPNLVTFRSGEAAELKR
jgi:hypothetical protein